METLTAHLVRNWWVPLVRGLLAILFGVLAFLWPGLTLSVLVIFFGAYALVDGVFAIVSAIRYRDRLERWWLWLIEGLLGVVVGVLTFLWPGLTAFVLLAFIAAWAIVTGTLEIVAAVELRKVIRGEWVLALSGALSIAFGVLLFVWPGPGLLSLAWLIGLYAVLFGIAFVALAFRLRRLGKDRRAVKA